MVAVGAVVRVSPARGINDKDVREKVSSRYGLGGAGAVHNRNVLANVTCLAANLPGIYVFRYNSR